MMNQKIFLIKIELRNLLFSDIELCKIQIKRLWTLSFNKIQVYFSIIYFACPSLN